MIATLSFWCVIAWVGERLCGRLVVAGGGFGGWQDKSSAVGWGGEAGNCWALSASRSAPLLAALPTTVAFLAFPAPSLVQPPKFT